MSDNSNPASAPATTAHGSRSAITAWLSRQNNLVFGAYAIAAAFSTYFCMYAFRKPFAGGQFEGEFDIFGQPVSYKILLTISQIIGYCLSKFIGIKVVSEMTGKGRALAIIGVISVAWAALLLFAVLPPGWNALAMFINGLPLGMVWGLVFGFLEGRRISEPLGAGLSASYIVASAIVKAIGITLVADYGISEQWMPFAVGFIFFPILVLSVFMLSRMPPPTPEDEAARVKREPMDGKARIAFVREFAPGIVLLTGLYMLLTAYRDFRDNFQVNILADAGMKDAAGTIATAETWVTVGVLAVLAALMLIKKNRTALLVMHAVMLVGSLLVGVVTWMFSQGQISAQTWMIGTGLGLYAGYVPYGCVLFDRLIAAVGRVATAGFLIYVTDAFGYLGSVGLLLYKEFGQANLSWLSFFKGFSYATAIVCAACFAASMAYFSWRTRGIEEQRSTPG